MEISKPKFKKHVHFAPTEDGVYFKTWTGEFVLKGKGLYNWIEQLAIHLDGTKNLKEITQNLSDSHAKFAQQIIHELSKREVITDASQQAKVELSDLEKGLYGDTIAYMEEQMPESIPYFAYFRQARLWLVGGGKSYKACVRALIQMGLKQPRLVATNRSDIESVITKWKDKDPDFQPLWVDIVSRNEGEIPDGVVYVEDHADMDLAKNWADWAWTHQVPFLSGFPMAEIGIVGPLVDRDSHVSFSCLLDRIHQKGDNNNSPQSPSFQLLVGNISALEYFKYFVQHPELEVKDRVILIEPEKLESVSQILAPSPFRSPPKETMSDFTLSDRAGIKDQAEFIERIEKLVDSHMGIFSELGPGALWQIPLPHSAITVHFPTSMKMASLRLAAAGETIQDATEAVAKRAVLIYAQEVSKRLEEEPEEPEILSWSIGRSYPEWVGRGLLKFSVQAFQKNEKAVLSLLSTAALPSVKQRKYAKMLQVHFGLEPTCVHAHFDLPNAHYVAIVSNDYLLGEGWGRTFGEAADEALLEAISEVQLSHYHKDEFYRKVSTPPWSDLFLSDEWIPISHSAEPLPWNEWLDDAKRFLHKQGQELVLKPWNKERFVLEAGMFVGQVGWKTRRMTT